MLTGIIWKEIIDIIVRRRDYSRFVPAAVTDFHVSKLTSVLHQSRQAPL